MLRYFRRDDDDNDGVIDATDTCQIGEMAGPLEQEQITMATVAGEDEDLG
ncbi:MAG: hypothetical protein CM15mP2_1470 [Methanobacteriota archaeon]|nr:MAG: hypothetical protein CM15mP2_1470 [Euryarchaeota archaeon]